MEDLNKNALVLLVFKRTWAALLLVCLWVLPLGAQANLHLLPIRIGIPHKTLALDYFLIDDFRVYLESRMNHQVEAVVHGLFNNSTAEMVRSKLDFAWVIDHPDSQFKDLVDLLAVPLYEGKPEASSYLIVSKRSTHAASLGQLRGAVFAFANRQPEGGYLDVRYQLLMAGENPERFFKRVFFTRSHKDVVKAVALGLAHGGAVDSVIWDQMVKTQPKLTDQVQVISRSATYGAPAFIANHKADPDDARKLQQLLLGMDKDPQGKELLKRMHVDAFVPGDARMYERQVQMRRALGEE